MPLDDLLIGTTEAREDKRVSIKDILTSLFSKTWIEQQTILSNDNINAIIKINALNTYTKTYYNLEFEILKNLISDKRLNIISLNGTGRKDIIEIIRAMQDQTMEIPEKKGFL